MSGPVEFLTTAANWAGNDGIGARLATHLWVSVLAVGAAAVVALPTGIAIGHTRRGRDLAVAVTNLSRAVPSLAVLAFVVAAGWGIGFVPTWIAMFALALPPLFVGAVTGVSEVDPAVVDAAVGMGMSASQVVRSVEIPLALPLVVSGLRVAVGQVIATATLGAFVGYNTLGRFITVGRANGNDGMLYGGVVVIVALAVAADSALQRWAKTLRSRR
ncbi:MAG: ABC transporter permease [Microthrixaceae bacterium]